eukprot:2109450-Rhodomonas_salina.3
MAEELGVSVPCHDCLALPHDVLPGRAMFQDVEHRHRDLRQPPARVADEGQEREWILAYPTLSPSRPGWNDL